VSSSSRDASDSGRLLAAWPAATSAWRRIRRSAAATEAIQRM